MWILKFPHFHNNRETIEEKLNNKMKATKNKEAKPKRTVYNTTYVQILTSSCEKWALSEKLKNKLKTTHLLTKTEESKLRWFGDICSIPYQEFDSM